MRRPAHRHRHRRHLHRRRAGRRRDRRHPRRQGAHHAGGPGAGLHGRARARPGRVPGAAAATWPPSSTPRPSRPTRSSRARPRASACWSRRGFRDILEIGRQIRSRLYDVHLQKPAPLVPRRWSLEVDRAARPRGPRAEALDSTARPGGATAAAGRRRGRRHLPAALLPRTPRTSARSPPSCARSCPDVFLSVSSDVCPEYREYLRASTTAVNAAVMPIVSRYVDALESRLHALGATAPFYVMQSNGGVMTSASAKARPVYMVESGPAAGVIAAGAIAAPLRLRERDVVRHGRHDRQGRPRSRTASSRLSTEYRGRRPGRRPRSATAAAAIPSARP